jgi:NodT family efflux transporter outer membrane factor (OMF) lipoprotein
MRIHSTLTLPSVTLTAFLLGSTACMVGPNYQRPTAPAPAAFKEPLPTGWKEADPNDGAIRGKWWEVYQDPTLNALEEQVAISNQNVLAAEANYRAARYAVRIARAGLFPTVAVGTTLTTATASSAVAASLATVSAPSVVATTYSAPVTVSWPADIWGSVRRSVRASQATAQADYALLENARLSYQSELAQDYFQLRGADGDIELLQRTVTSYADYLKLTHSRYNAGVASGADVAEAQTQLDTTRAQLIDLGVTRQQFEHAIAMLVGKAPSQVEISSAVLKNPPPPIPVALPSALLERRPDVAAAERQMASLHEQIGIAVAAYYPTLDLVGSLGFSGLFSHGFLWPSRFFSATPNLTETVYDAGKRRAQVKEAEALFDSSVANYRETVLTSFQQVEDDLAALRILANEAIATDQAVKAAEDSLTISTAQYKAGIVAYLQVITAQAAALSAERTAVDLLTRRLVSSVMLIQALGGGWGTTMPGTTEMLRSQ